MPFSSIEYLHSSYRVVTMMILFLLSMPTAGARDLAVSQIGMEQGLSNNHVMSIVQDKYGFIWVATDDGLNRFDGSVFKNYFKDTQDSRSVVSGNELNYLMDDPHKPVLWIATQRAGLNAYNYETNKTTVYKHDPDNKESIITDDITHISPAVDGGLWVSTYWNGIDHFNPGKGKFTHYNSSTIANFPKSPVWKVVDNGDGKLYVAHGKAGFTVVSLADRKATTYVNNPEVAGSLPGEDVLSVSKDDQNNIWVGTNRGLSLFNPEDGTFIDFSKGHDQLRHPVFDIRQFSNNKLWIAMEDGIIAVLDLSRQHFTVPENLQFDYIYSNVGWNRLSNPSVRSLFEDKYGNVWAGTWGGGVNFISKTHPLFEIHGYRNLSNIIPPNHAANTTLVDDSDRLWVGTDGGGILVYEGERLQHNFTKGADGLPTNYIQCSYKDDDGSIWFGLYKKGVIRFDVNSGKFQQIHVGNDREDVRVIVRSSDGKIIIGTSEGIYRYDRSSGQAAGPYMVSEDNLIRAIQELPDGRFAIGTFGDGLLVTNSAFDVLKEYDTYSGFPSNTVHQIFKDSQGRIWAATGNGLVRFNDIASGKNDYRLYDRRSGLINSHITAIAEDRQGHIWVSTNNSISVLLGDKFHNYNHLDNIPNNNFLAHSVANDSTGNIYFGSIEGACRFNPEEVLKEHSLPLPMITEIRVADDMGMSDKTPTVIDAFNVKKIKLRYNQNSFDISFSMPDHAFDDRIEYAYSLSGYSDKWYTVTDGNTVSFHNLPPGKYTFLIKSRIRNQEWSSETNSLEIIITPPLWLTWWAKTLYCLMALAIVFGMFYIYRRRTNAENQLKLETEKHEKERELNDERLRFFTNITHELRTPLTLIFGPLEDVVNSNNLPAKERRNINMVHQNAKKLLDLVNRILEFRKTETRNKRLCVMRRNLASTIYEVGLKYKELNRNKKLKIKIDVQENDMVIFYDKEVIVTILDNLISNAIKYTETGRIDIVCKRIDDKVEISVADTGYGISANAITHIFDRYYQGGGTHQASGTGIGLALVKNLVTLHHGEVGVKSEEGKGSVFTVTIPYDDTYPDALHTEETAEPAKPSAEYPAETGSAETEKTETGLGEAAKPLILIVEDNEDIRDYIADTFTDLYDVRCAKDGKEGVDMALSLIPDLIVSDVMMPRMDGIELCQKLKNEMRTSHIPIILLTAKESLSDREEGYLSGADSYLTKPFSSGLLQSRINNLLEQRRKLTEQYSEKNDDTQAPDTTLEDKRNKLTKSLSDLDKAFIDKLTLLVTDHVAAENVDVNFLSTSMCMSTSTLYRKVKALTGLSPNEFIRKTRMGMAEDLLLEGKYSISEIAFKVGINSTAYFRQCFKEEFGVTPSEYLKNLQGN